MKLASILVQYLHARKRLELPGIGTFLLDSSVTDEPDTTKNAKPDLSAHINFNSNPSLKEAPDLITYISEQTGKMKALASADLYSHLELARQFLNIGKPFLFEGIGSLVKTKSGSFEFAAGELMPEKLKEVTAKEISATAASGESFSEYHNIFKQQTVKAKWKKPVIVLLLVAGLGLAIWGGYTISQKRKDKETNLTSVTQTTEPTAESVIKDTAGTKKDSVPPVKTDSTVINTANPVQQTMVPVGNKKFVLEIAGAKRAFERYNKLKAYLWKVQMETNDSVQYKLFLIIPAAASDTARIADSLTNLNGRKVYIEN